MATNGICRYLIFRYGTAFSLRLVKRISFDCPHCIRERINVGAYEADVLADVYICCISKLFLSLSQKLLVHQASRNPSWPHSHSVDFLHLQRRCWKIARLDQYCDILRKRCYSVCIRGRTAKKRHACLQKTDSCCDSVVCVGFAVYYLHVPHPKNRSFPRPDKQHLRNILIQYSKYKFKIFFPI